MWPLEVFVELMDDIGFLLAYSSGRAVRVSNAHLSPLGIRVRHYAVLSAACDADGISQREIAGILSLDPSQIVALVDDLQAAGLAKRVPAPSDRRTRLVIATSRGLTVRERAKNAIEAAHQEFLAPLGKADRDALREILRRVVLEDHLERRHARTESGEAS